MKVRARGRDGTVAGRTIDRADALAQAAADEAGTSVLRAGRVPLTDSNRKRRVEQEERGLRAPCHRGVAVAVAEEQVHGVEEQVCVVEEGITEERVVHDTDTTIGVSTELSIHTDGAFPGGPSDKSVLTEHPVLKLASHGSNLKNFPERLMPEQVVRIVGDFHLMDFAGCSLTMLDAPLLLAFIERWNPETSSFHLPFGEMTETLDDVHSLFHLPIAETILQQFIATQATAVRMVMNALEIDEVVVLKEFGDARGFHIRMSWLRKAWGAAAVTMLYTALDVASRPDTIQLAGYMSLLYCWIYEHFPQICERKIQHCADACRPMCKEVEGQTGPSKKGD
ncbi:protein MAIN-LIKE 1-like [Vicia villosa]|uniref:protein MAIN-LIKE 1-like n=1 Tax=Vicia villosa TaxID=3911 RepID=UPI00273C014C|nr:protein MAIN-LIKE 1-like [Vicia villosa]